MGRKGRCVMTSKSIVKIVKSLKSISDVITTELVERVEESVDSMEARARNSQLRKEWFERFHSLPAGYRVTTYRTSTHKVEFDTKEAVLVCNKEGGEVNVATPFVDENGNKMFLVRDIYGVDEYTIPREEVILLYKGSVENCWLRWYTSAKSKLG